MRPKAVPKRRAKNLKSMRLAVEGDESSSAVGYVSARRELSS